MYLTRNMRSSLLNMTFSFTQGYLIENSARNLSRVGHLVCRFPPKIQVSTESSKRISFRFYHPRGKRGGGGNSKSTKKAQGVSRWVQQVYIRSQAGRGKKELGYFFVFFSFGSEKSFSERGRESFSRLKYFHINASISGQGSSDGKNEGTVENRDLQRSLEQI